MTQSSDIRVVSTRKFLELVYAQTFQSPEDQARVRELIDKFMPLTPDLRKHVASVTVDQGIDFVRIGSARSPPDSLNAILVSTGVVLCSLQLRWRD